MKKADLILVLLIIAVSAASLGVRYLTRTEGGRAVVTADGIETAEYPLNEDLEVDIQTPQGVNHLVIRNGTASVTDADCPDRLCVKMGSIEKSGQSIICLPHKVVVEIEGGQDPSDMDVMVR